MAFSKINEVVKLNKGTSKSEWGVLNFWGYKTPDGLIRSRVMAPNDDGIAVLDVRKYEMNPGSWRRKLTFEDSIQIGLVHVKVPDTDKGFTSQEALDEVNAVIEIHNSHFEKHAGRKVLTKDYNGKYGDTPTEVTGVSFSIADDDKQLVILRHDRWQANADDCKDYTDDMAVKKVADKLASLRKSLKASEAFLDSVEAAFDAGVEATRSNAAADNYASEGLIAHGEVRMLLDDANALVPTKAAV